MSTQNTRNALVLATLLTSSVVAAPAIAGPSTHHLSAASSHSVAAAAHSGAAVVKGVAAVAAVPLVTVGASGMASAVAGSALHEYASEPLRIGHEVLHTDPRSKKNPGSKHKRNKQTTTPNPAEQMLDPKQGKK